jgi:hypothetical protein
MIRFPYRSFPVRGRRSGIVEVVYRPIIPFRVIGPAGGEDEAAWVDTGADDTLLPAFLIDRLGVTFAPSDHSIIEGIEGSMSVVRYGTVDLEILGSGGGYRWSARVGFHAGHKIVFGHNGFLEYFTASFNGRTRHLTLTPNGNAPSPTHP